MSKEFYVVYLFVKWKIADFLNHFTLHTQ